MTLVLHQHPFAAYCQKVLTALYELELPFETVLVEGREEHLDLWPLGSIPVLVDTGAGLTLPESTTIIEHLDAVAGGGRLIPSDPASATQARLWDRLVDNHVSDQMGKIVTDNLRPQAARDAHGVDEARRTLTTAYGVLEQQLDGNAWLAGNDFTIADCGAAPALFYCHAIHRWGEEEHPELARYYRSLTQRPSFARVIEEARPYRQLFPLPWPEDQDRP